VQRLGEPPTHPLARERWLRDVLTVAAYRDRYAIDAGTAVGARPTSEAHRLDAGRAGAALHRATSLANEAAEHRPRLTAPAGRSLT
jgi:hypothetical protein